jgi:hypothetical protein
MSSSTLVKPLLHNSIADAVYSEISSRTGRYYYFLGSAIDWQDPLNPPTPVDSYKYELDTRANIIIIKEIQSNDVAYIVDKINWVSGTVYDMYDDSYSTQLSGIDLEAGGVNYSANTLVTITGGGGTGATANATVVDGEIVYINLETPGQGYTNKPNVVILDSFGTGAIANAVLSYAYSGAANLQTSNFYVITDDFNIYKCLDNNNDVPSTVKPVETGPVSFTTSDGYKWKFIGNVPISLRNKFLTSTQVPVTTSLSSSFYSRGEIKDIIITDTGNNYNYARLVVQGDGYLENEPYLLIQPNVINGGLLYTAANVTIDPPFDGAITWTSLTAFNDGDLVQHENNIYEVVIGGTTAAYPPVHTNGIYSNGTVGLKYKGTQLTANANIAGGSIVGLEDYNALVREIVITNNGSGYLTAPSVNITGGGGSNASAYCTLTGNTINRIYFIDYGKNYSSPPTIIFGEEWQANTAYSLNDQIFYNTRLYTVSSAGTTNTTAPTFVTGTQTLGTANLTYAGVKATGYAVLKYGSGYSKTPNIIIDGDGSFANLVFEIEKTEAIMYPYIEDGKITNVIIEDGGIGYTYATITAVGDGSNAEFLVNFSKGDLDTLQSTSELLAIPGAIHSIKVVSGGYGYTGATATIFGDGTGATANVNILNGRITKINVVSEGSGYTKANVVITGTGVGAAARAIISPVGGHGKDTVLELFAKKLAFYSTINREKNQGFDVTNDYRQFGIIKNIRNYLNNKYYSDLTGSACWLVSGNINTSLFAEDTIVTSEGKRYVIIASDTNGMLISSLDGDTNPPSTGVYTEPTGNSFTASGITEPDVDKYSGELLFIENRLAFTTTEDQAVSIKTVFNY